MGKRLPDAVMAVSEELVPFIRKMDTNAARRSLEPTHLGLLGQAQTTLVKLKDMASDQKEDPLFLQSFIVALLSYLNLVPGTTEQRVNTRGKGEAKWLRIIRTFEYGSERGPATSASSADWNDSSDEDSEGADGVLVEPEEEEEDDASNMNKAIEKLFDGVRENGNEKWLDHLRIVSRTYPKAFAASRFSVPRERSSNDQAKTTSEAASSSSGQSLGALAVSGSRT